MVATASQFLLLSSARGNNPVPDWNTTWSVVRRSYRGCHLDPLFSPGGRLFSWIWLAHRQPSTRNPSRRWDILLGLRSPAWCWVRRLYFRRHDSTVLVLASSVRGSNVTLRLRCVENWGESRSRIGSLGRLGPGYDLIFSFFMSSDFFRFARSHILLFLHLD